MDFEGQPDVVVLEHGFFATAVPRNAVNGAFGVFEYGLDLGMVEGAWAVVAVVDVR